MANIFAITPEIRNLAKAAFSDLIDQLSKPVKLVYPPKMERCDNCVYNPVGKKSSNVYVTGGPIPFPLGSICPLCGGAGMRATENSDIVNLLINEDVKTFDKSLKLDNTNIYYPAGTIQCKGYVRDLPKILKCDYMIKDMNLQPMMEYRYKRYGEPMVPGNIVQDYFFISLWQRI